MRCWLCNTTEKREFEIHDFRFICDDCIATLDFFYKEALKDFRNRHDTAENEFLEALAEYVSYKQDEYNEQLRKERKNG